MLKKLKNIRRYSWTLSFMTKKGILQIVIKDTYVYISSILIVFLFLSSLCFTLSGIKKRSLLAEFKSKVEVRDGYISSLRDLQDDIDHLKEKIEKHSQFNDKLRFSTDVPSLERKLRIEGIGGPSPIDTLKGKLSRFSFKIVSEIMREVNFTDKSVDLEDISYDEVYKKLAAIVDLKKHTPSIWPTHGRITSGFGYRRHPIKGYVELHRGLDIANIIGTRIYATADGVVDFAGRMQGYGRYLSIDHGYGFKTKYGHLQTILVEEGQIVKRGDLIATMGKSGLATGSHLHYEVRVLNNPVNPLHYIIRDTLTY
jgi:murein DD-endopeptidase MepM/ murein hydrolase activator NlpD